MTDAWPTQLRLHDAGAFLAVSFEDGRSYDLPAEYLRVESPSAEVQGHSADERKTVPGKRHVRVVEVEPVGNYAVRLTFDDGHSTGIYTWPYLAELGQEQAGKWASYLTALQLRGFSRDMAEAPAGGCGGGSCGCH